MISGTVRLAVFEKTMDGIGRKMELVFVLGMILAVCMFEARSRRCREDPSPITANHCLIPQGPRKADCAFAWSLLGLP